MKFVFLFILGIMVFFSCRYIGGKRVRGNGNFVSRERSVSNFDGVEAYGSFDVTVLPAPTTSVKIETDENLQEFIETYVEHGDLQIRERDGYNLRPQHDIKITVSGPVFTNLATHGSGNIIGRGPLNTSDGDVELRVAGSGNVEVEMTARKIDSEIHGSGNIKVRGATKEFEGGIYGSGNIRAGELRSEDAKIEIAGSGNAEIFSNKNLDVHIMGSGEVRHRGGASVNTSIQGSGSVVRID
ncbi:MAG: DUF2807 domain-containing protein [Chitinophagaceae bacterium]|nr:DUF2807 domain-containing protein [Chitinophagaceae bacterium]